MKRKINKTGRGIRLSTDDERFLKNLQKKYPEQNISTLIRRAIRELAERELAEKIA